MADTTYEVRTDLPPAMVTSVAIEIFMRWIAFALGDAAIGNHRIVYPSGRYAASIQYRQEGEATVAITASAPEADILEHGHGPVDLKTRLQAGRHYRMHRPVGATPGTPLRRRGAGPASMKPKMWAELRQQERSGFATLSANAAPGSWIIPAMPAYSVGMVLAAQAEAMAKGTS